MRRTATWRALVVLGVVLTASRLTAQTTTVVDPILGVTVTATTTYTVTKTCPVLTLSMVNPAMVAGVAVVRVVSTLGGTAPYSYLVSTGTLPAGLSLTSTGILSGTPTSAGSVSVILAATDSQNCKGTLGVTLVVTPAVVICPVLTLAPWGSTSGVTGTVFSQAIATTGGASPYTYALSSGTLPAGLTLSAAGLVAGTPTTAGSSTFSVKATDTKACPGTQSYTVTVTNPIVITGIAIAPGTNIQSVVNTSPSPSAFVLKAGTHRLQSVTPRTGDTFTGEPGTILSGARLLTTFTPSGALFVVSGQSQHGLDHGFCDTGIVCNLPEQLFFDDVPLIRVATLAEVRIGTWYLDYTAQTITFADNPSGHTVETSVTTAAFLGAANSVTVQNLTIEKYASDAQYGAIIAEGGRGWIVSGNDVRWNHGGGIRTGHAATIRTNHVHHNGQIGIVGGGDDLLVEGNEIDHNNTGQFAIGWEAGGTKFAGTNRLTVRGNFVHHNAGPGLWTDINNYKVLVETNRVEDNTWMGIFHEISFDAIIRNNVVNRNGLGFPDWIWGAGILVAASPNVEIYGNTLTGNADGIGAVQQNRPEIPSPLGPHEISNLWVHDNTITQAGGWAAGMVDDISDLSYYATRNNRFSGNTYVLSGGAGLVWKGAGRSLAEWQAMGQQ